MKKPKLYSIIIALNGTRLSLVEKYLKSDKRKTLLLLFQLIKKAEGEIIDKEILFYKLFKKKYSAANDYILRNEMRLLVEKIESTVILFQLEKQLESDEFFKLQQQLQLYKSLDLFDIYEEKWKEAKLIAQQQFQYQEIIKLNADFFEYAQFHIRSYKNRSQLYEQLMEENIQNTNFFLAKQYAFNNFIEGNTNKLRLEFQIPQTHHIPIEKANITLSKYSTQLNQYYILVGKWFPEQSKGQTHLLLEALDALQQCTPKNEIYHQEYLRVLYLIATDYSMSAAFDKADTYFEKIMEILSVNANINKPYYLYNYAVNLTKLDNYNKAINVIDNVEKDISSTNVFLKEKYQLLKIICYVFTKNTEKLKSTIPTDFSELLPEYRVYYRFVNAIYYIIKNEFAVASEEINNMLRSKLINEIDIHFLSVAKFYKTVLNETIKEDTIHLSGEALLKIKQLADEIDNTEMSVVINYMPYKWLKSALKI